MTSSRLLSFALLAATIPALTGAGFLPDYQCTIERIDSSIRPGGMSGDSSKGKQFSVNRQTGVMTEALKNAFHAQPTVIDEGSSENAFKAVTTFKQDVGSGVYVINVAEFADTQKKPFIYTSGSDVYFGHCVHY